jgi:hypothetical protein
MPNLVQGGTVFILLICILLWPFALRRRWLWASWKLLCTAWRQQAASWIRLLKFRLGFLTGLSSFPASPPSGLAGWLLRACFLPPVFFCFVMVCKPCRDLGLALASKNQVQPSSGFRHGRSPLPSVTVSYPSPTQDPVAPRKRVVAGRTVALPLYLLQYLTPASKNQVPNTCKLL